MESREKRREPDTWEDHWRQNKDRPKGNYASSEENKLKDPDALKNPGVAPPLTMEKAEDIIAKLHACGYGFCEVKEYDLEDPSSDEGDGDDGGDEGGSDPDHDEDDQDDDHRGTPKKSSKRRASSELTGRQKRRSLRKGLTER